MSKLKVNTMKRSNHETRDLPVPREEMKTKEGDEKVEKVEKIKKDLLCNAIVKSTGVVCGVRVKTGRDLCGRHAPKESDKKSIGRPKKFDSTQEKQKYYRRERRREKIIREFEDLESTDLIVIRAYLDGKIKATVSVS